MSSLHMPPTGLQRADAQRVAEEMMNRNVKYGQLGPLLQNLLGPFMGQTAAQITQTNVTIEAAVGLLIDLGVFTREQYATKLAEVARKVAQTLSPDAQETDVSESAPAQSPAQEGARAAAQGAPVTRLTEPLGEGASGCIAPDCACDATGVCAVGTHEAAPRRVLEG